MNKILIKRSIALGSVIGLILCQSVFADGSYYYPTQSSFQTEAGNGSFYQKQYLGNQLPSSDFYQPNSVYRPQSNSWSNISNPQQFLIPGYGNRTVGNSVRETIPRIPSSAHLIDLETNYSYTFANSIPGFYSRASRNEERWTVSGSQKYSIRGATSLTAGKGNTDGSQSSGNSSYFDPYRDL